MQGDPWHRKLRNPRGTLCTRAELSHVLPPHGTPFGGHVMRVLEETRLANRPHGRGYMGHVHTATNTLNTPQKSEHTFLGS